jgi:hypothetical protein
MNKTYDVIIMTEGSDPVFNVARGIGGYKIASALRNEGYSVFVLNNFTHFIQKGNINQILDKLIGENTLWVGFSSSLFMRKKKDVYTKRHTRDSARQNILWRWPTADEDIQTMTDYIRDKGVKTVYGGSMTHWRAKEVKDQIDYYVVGMGEHPALHLSDHLRNGTKLNYNIAYGKTPYILDYDQKGDLFDFRNSKINYVPEDFWCRDEGMGIEFGRGCIFKCKFCAYPLIGKKKGDQSFLRDKECIKHELQQNYDLYGTTKYVIIDDTFNEQTTKLQAIADAIDELELPVKLQFSAFIRIDLVAKFPEQLELLKKINVCAWFLGIESLNYESAKTIGKGCPKETIFNTIRKSREIFNGSLSVYGSFIAGLPYDNRETMDVWTKEVFENRDLFDAYSFSPLELGTASELSRRADYFGYTIDKTKDKKNSWYNERTSDEVVEYVKELQENLLDDIKVSTFFLMFYQCLGYTFDELRQLTFTELFENSKVRRKARQYLEKNYYSKVEEFLGVEEVQPNIKYMKTLPIAQDLKDKLRYEFNTNESNAKVFTASNETETRSIDNLRVIRHDDMKECNVANAIAQHVSSIIGCEASPRYYVQEEDSYLKPHRDHGTVTAINIMLGGTGPITWDEDIDVYYDCALLNVQQMHSVQTSENDTRIFLKLAIFDKTYEEVLESISGKEHEIFNVVL